MTPQEAIDTLTRLAGVRYAHSSVPMSDHEQKEFLRAVMLVSGEPAASLAAGLLNARERLEKQQLEFKELFRPESPDWPWRPFP